MLPVDLRIAGFADLSSLYFSLSTQMEQFFASLKNLLEGYEQFEKESWAFKHDRLAIEKRVDKGGQVKTADIAHLMELFQSSLLKYWEFEPSKEERTQDSKDEDVAQAGSRSMRQGADRAGSRRKGYAS